MVIDSSAVLAIILVESEAETIRQAMWRAHELVMSAVTALESRMVLRGRRGVLAVTAFDNLLGAAEVDIASFDAGQARLAFDAFLRYGKGTGHPARLNMGDCAAYALARSRGMPLLFKGTDFRLTDVTPAI